MYLRYVPGVPNPASVGALGTTFSTVVTAGQIKLNHQIPLDELFKDL